MKAIFCGCLFAAAATGLAYAADDGGSNLAMVNAAPPDRALSAPGGLNLAAGQDSSTVSLTASRTHSYLAPRREDLGFVDRWTLTASAPLNIEGRFSDVGTLDGLANTASLELRFSHLRSSAQRGVDMTKAGEICAEANTAAGKTGADAARGCDASLVQNYAPARLQEFLGLGWSREANVVVFGASAKLGRKQFDYYDPTTLAKLTDNTTPWSAGHHGRGE